MRLVMVDGEERDATRLLERLRTAGFVIDVQRISVSALSPQASGAWLESPAPGPPLDSAPEGSRPRALLFEKPECPDVGVATLEAVRACRPFDAIPAIISLTTDQSDWFGRVHGFDDFLLHPWSPAELLGRIRAAEMRLKGRQPEALLEINGVHMDKAAREARVDGRSVHLTLRELALLTYLCVRRGNVLSRDHLLEHVWGEAYHGGPRTVDVHIRRLRSKLGYALQIDTVRSGGYRLRDEARTSRPNAREAPLWHGGGSRVEQQGIAASDPR